LANLAAIVDETLSADPKVTSEENDVLFLTTFGVLTAIGLLWSGTLLTLAGVFQLANMGSYLPFPVICGFFSAVGILIWTLAVSVDTGGLKIGHILFSGDWEVFQFFVIHHTPTVIVAVIMKYLGPKNPFFVIMVVFATIGSAYIIMFVCGISLDEAKDMGWFWAHKDLVYKNHDSLVCFVCVCACVLVCAIVSLWLMQFFVATACTVDAPFFRKLNLARYSNVRTKPCFSTATTSFAYGEHRLDLTHGLHQLPLVYFAKHLMGVFTGVLYTMACLLHWPWDSCIWYDVVSMERH
jgi:hypothetical protein